MACGRAALKQQEHRNMEDAYAAHASSSIGARKRREATEGGSSPIKRIKLEDEERPVVRSRLSDEGLLYINFPCFFLLIGQSQYD